MPTTYAVTDDHFRNRTDRVTGWRPGDYRHADRGGNMAANTADHIREAALAAGLDPLPWEGFVSYCERGKQLDAAAAKTYDTGEARRHVIRQLVTGEIEPEQGAIAAAELEAGRTAKTAPRLLRDAAGAAYASACGFVSRWGEQLITAELAPRIADLLDEVHTLAARLPEHVTTDRTALAGGSTVADAWNRLAQMHAQWQALHTLADTCRGDGLLPPDIPSGKQSARALYSPLLHRYARADLAEADPELHRRPAALVLLHAQWAGWQPGIFTAEQARANLAAINDGQLAAQAKG